MSKITEKQVHEVYIQARRVHAKEISIPEAKNFVTKASGMKGSSANGYISAFLKLMKGEEYKWTVNAYATNYFLEKIKQEYGTHHLKVALNGVRKHIQNNSNSLKNIRNILNTYDAELEKDSLQTILSSFEKDVSRSLLDLEEARQLRLENSEKTVKEVMVTTKVFLRNPDVVASTLTRANGICEKCKKPAPFKRAKDKTPFLEVHHKVQLAHGGKDTIENTLALCPNCHRELHFGV